jgi:hypothetical protein
VHQAQTARLMAQMTVLGDGGSTREDEERADGHLQIEVVPCACSVRAHSPQTRANEWDAALHASHSREAV